MTDAAAPCGLILAAGAGARFDPRGGSSKLLALLDGRPLLEWAVRAQVLVGALERVVVVLGAFATDVLAAVDLGRAEPIVCRDWAEGQSASLRCGLRALEGAERVVVTLGDQPGLSPAVIKQVLASKAPARAVYRGVPGHPVLLGPVEIAAALELTGDRGARELLGAVQLVECGPEVGLDVDTVADLEAMRREARAVI